MRQVDVLLVFIDQVYGAQAASLPDQMHFSTPMLNVHMLAYWRQFTLATINDHPFVGFGQSLPSAQTIRQIPAVK